MATLNGLFMLGRDAELRSTANGDQVAGLSLAYNYGRKGTDGRMPTQWVKASLWGERAAKLAEHLTKGRQIYAEISDLHVETYKKQDGSEGVNLSGRIGQIEFVKSAPQAASAPPAPTPPKPRAAPANNGSGFEDMDDDIPF